MTINIPLSKADLIARALKNGWTYVSRQENIITLRKEGGKNEA